MKVSYTKCQKFKALSILTFSLPLLRSSSERLSLLRSSSRRRSVKEKGQFKRLTFDTEFVSQFVRTTKNFFRNQLSNHTSKPYSYICRYTIYRYDTQPNTFVATLSIAIPSVGFSRAAAAVAIPVSISISATPRIAGSFSVASAVVVRTLVIGTIAMASFLVLASISRG